MLAVSARKFFWKSDSRADRGHAEASDLDANIGREFVICGLRQNVTVHLETRHYNEDGVAAWTYTGRTREGKLVKVAIIND